MNYNHMLEIAIKDMKEAFDSISVYGPMIGIPLFFAINAADIHSVHIAVRRAWRCSPGFWASPHRRSPRMRNRGNSHSSSSSR